MSAPVVAGLLAALAVLAGPFAVSGAGPVLGDRAVKRRAARLHPSRGGPLTGAAPVPVPGWLASVGRWARRRVRAWLDGRAVRAVDQQLPVLLDQTTRHLRAGASLPFAVRSAAEGSADPSTRRLAGELAAGAPLAEAVAGWHAAAPTPGRALAAAALDLAAESGGAVAVVLDGVTDTLRDRVALAREVAALSSQARASAAVLVAAPVVFAALAAAADRRVADVLLGHPLGWACLAGGAALDATGAAWMSRLVRRAR